MVNAGREDAVEAVREASYGDGARAVFMATRTPLVLPDCIRAADNGGVIAVTGSAPGAVGIELQVDLLRRELTIFGTYQAFYPHEPYHMFQWPRPRNREYVIELMARGELARRPSDFTSSALYRRRGNVCLDRARTDWLAGNRPRLDGLRRDREVT